MTKILQRQTLRSLDTCSIIKGANGKCVQSERACFCSIVVKQNSCDRSGNDSVCVIASLPSYVPCKRQKQGSKPAPVTVRQIVR